MLLCNITSRAVYNRVENLACKVFNPVVKLVLENQPLSDAWASWEALTSGLYICRKSSRGEKLRIRIKVVWQVVRGRELCLHMACQTFKGNKTTARGGKCPPLLNAPQTSSTPVLWNLINWVYNERHYCMAVKACCHTTDAKYKHWQVLPHVIRVTYCIIYAHVCPHMHKHTYTELYLSKTTELYLSKTTACGPVLTDHYREVPAIEVRRL